MHQVVINHFLHEWPHGINEEVYGPSGVTGGSLEWFWGELKKLEILEILEILVILAHVSYDAENERKSE